MINNICPKICSQKCTYIFPNIIIIKVNNAYTLYKKNYTHNSLNDIIAFTSWHGIFCKEQDQQLLYYPNQGLSEQTI